MANVQDMKSVGAQTNYPIVEEFAPANFLGGSALIDTAGNQGLPFSYSFEPQRRNNGMLFAPIPELKVMAQFPFNLPVLSLALRSVELPKDENDIIDLGWFNQRVKYAGQHHTEDITVTFIDYIDAPVMHILESWRASVYNAELGAVDFAGGRRGSLFGGYKQDVYLMTFSPNIDWVYTKVYRLRGAFPMRLDRGDLDYADDEPLEVSITLSYDEVTFILHGFLPEAMLYYNPQAAGGRLLTAGSLREATEIDLEIPV